VSQSDIASPGRRRFLGVLAAGGTAAAGVAVAGVPVNMEPETARAKTAEPAAKPQGYQETAHVRRYYELARG
jgi:hypothetical protein